MDINQEQIFLKLAEEYKQAKNWFEYNTIMMVRNDWLQDHGYSPEYEIYCITEGEYSDYNILGYFQGVKGLNLDHICLQWTKELKIDEKSLKKVDDKYNYIRNIIKEKCNTYNITNAFISYLKNTFKMFPVEISETNISLYFW